MFTWYDGYFYVSTSLECPGVWSNIILGVTGRVFLGEINIWMVDWVEQVAVLQVDGYHTSGGLNSGKKKKADLLTNKKKFLLPDCFELGRKFLFSALRLQLKYQFFWFSSLWTWTSYTIGSSGSPALWLQIF